MLCQSFFITGTDTDIGKTYVSSLIFKTLTKNNQNTIYYKPIQSGCYFKNSILTAPDVDTVSKNLYKEYDKSMCSYYLLTEVSPHLAAEKENLEINLEKIISETEERKSKCDYLIVEGAGGVYVPLVRDKFYIFDLIKNLSLPIILIVGTKVGAINHTMLTIKFLENMNIKIHGIIFNRYKGEFYEDDNIKVILHDGKINNYLTIKENQQEIDYLKLKDFLLGGN